jgi:peptidoglycan-N-acetylglucosamine deacetylase
MTGNGDRPIFFDPDNRRWPRLRRGVFLSALIVSVLFASLIISVLITPILPALNLPPSQFLPAGARVAPPRPEPLLTKHQRALREAKHKLELERSKKRTAVVERVASPLSGQDPVTAAFYVNWDESSFSSLKENIANPECKLDLVIAESLHLKSAEGELKEDDPAREREMADMVRATRPDIRLMALVNNFNGHDWEDQILGQMLANPEGRANVIRQLVDYAGSRNYGGVSIDFENLPAESRSALVEFMKELNAAAKNSGLTVSINVPADNNDFDYTALSALVDYVILMAYDQHWSSKDIGPVSGLDWFTDILRIRQADVPPSKLIVAIGNYAYDWKVGSYPETKTFEDTVLTARDSEGRISVDPNSLNPTFDYVEGEGAGEEKHQVWMLDAVTAFNQVAVARSFGARGIALWRLGSEDPSVWTFFGSSAPLDAGAAANLAQVRYGYGLDYEGRGEILRISAEPQVGHRAISFDSTRGFIVGETFTAFPSPYVITRYGGAEKKIALTFDDGPDPQYTPKILDILREAKAPATFFIIGLNGERFPGILERIVNEGHEIGNHTFTHPNIANISATQFKLELSATQRLFESVVGRESLLFRPPYAEDSEPNTPEEVAPLEFVNERNYLTVGMLIDPGDWKRPGVDEIVKRTVDIAMDISARGESGNVVLLHDGGGDRSETIQALPLLIAALREKGFQLVAVSDLLGKSRDEVMPPIPPDDWWRAISDRTAFTLVNLGMSLISWLFLGGIVLGVGRLVLIGTIAALERWRERHASYDPVYRPTVAVIVPAYNEEKVIVKTIVSLLAADHPSDFEIVVVDDGSEDATCAKVCEAFGDEPRVRAFTKPNEGKAAALNFGVAHTNAEIVIALDADTIFARDTITKLIRHFDDPSIGAVAGNAKVGNRVNLLTRWQALEYITSQNLERRAFSLLNCITVVPGAVGAWRRELVERAGGFTSVTLAEDADLTMSIRKLGYSISYEDEAIGLTEAPDTVRAFIQQRYRWMYGTLQAAWKHRDALFRRRFGSLGFVALPNILIFQALFPLISPFMDLFMLVSLGMSAFNWWNHPAEYSAQNLWPVLFYYALFVAVDFAAAALAFVLEPKENRRLLVWLFWQRFFYRQLMYYVAIKSTMASLRGIAVGWGKLERKDTVKA